MVFPCSLSRPVPRVPPLPFLPLTTTPGGPCLSVSSRWTTSVHDPGAIPLLSPFILAISCPQPLTHRQVKDSREPSASQPSFDRRPRAERSTRPFPVDRPLGTPLSYLTPSLDRGPYFCHCHVFAHRPTGIAGTDTIKDEAFATITLLLPNVDCHQPPSFLSLPPTSQLPFPGFPPPSFSRKPRKQASKRF